MSPITTLNTLGLVRHQTSIESHGITITNRIGRHDARVPGGLKLTEQSREQAMLKCYIARELWCLMVLMGFSRTGQFLHVYF